MSVAFITARLGSKRLKRKNIKNFYGRPVISYSILACIKCKSFDRVIVSTESELIAKIARKYSAEVPHLRPRRLAKSKTTTLELIKYLVKKFQLKKNQIVCCVYPVAPLLKPSFLEKSIKVFKKLKCDFLLPVVKVRKFDKSIFAINKKNIIIKYDRVSKVMYKDTGQFYIGTANSFLNSKSILYSGNSKAIVVRKNSALDVNTIHDWNKLKKMFLKK